MNHSPINDLHINIDKIHITDLGITRINKNLEMPINDVTGWCREKIKNADQIIRKGKNWYVHCDNSIITINADSYTIITAHKKQTEKKTCQKQ